MVRERTDRRGVARVTWSTTLPTATLRLRAPRVRRGGTVHRTVLSRSTTVTTLPVPIPTPPRTPDAHPEPHSRPAERLVRRRA